MIEIRTARLMLRDFGPEDVDAIHAVVGDDRVTRWLSFDSRTKEQAATMLAGVLKRQQLTPRTEFYLAITPAGGPGEVLGFARLGLGGVQAADLGYALRPEAQGRGYAREAAAGLLDFGFSSLGLHRVAAMIGPENKASIAVVEGLGFQLEGRVRDHVHTHGAWRDSLQWSLLSGEWAAGQLRGHTVTAA